MARFKGLSVLLCTGMIVWALPVQAGFEFTAPKAQPAPAPSAAPAADPSMAPMPIVPNEPVTAEPLGMPNAAAPAPIAAVAPVKPEGDPVYIRRQRSTVAVKVPKNEPMDTDALLKATENGESVAMTNERLNAMPAKQTGKLVINPYPLDETASHNDGGMGKLSVEQAMMEEGGTLRPVAVPGKNNSTGLRARAQITSRYDSGSQYLDRKPQMATAANTNSGALTPIPGGEGEPLNGIDMVPLPAPNMVSKAAIAPAPAPLVPARASAMPTPAIPANYPVPATPDAPSSNAAPATNASGFTDAVGFGRDLPLALAMSQVIPPDYSYAFGQNVNVGSTVSWQGGKPWNEVLNDMLAPNGMRAVIQGKQITIVRA